MPLSNQTISQSSEQTIQQPAEQATKATLPNAVKKGGKNCFQKRHHLTAVCLGGLCVATSMMSANVLSDDYWGSMRTAAQTTVTEITMETVSKQRPTTTLNTDTKTAETETPALSANITSSLTPEVPESPSQNSINTVVSYYFGDDAAPILADYKLCSDVGSVGAERNQCLGELSADSLVRGQTVYLWMNYLVPKGTQTDLLLHYNHNGITRDASNLKVSGSIRFRTWKKIKLSRSGTWELPIYFEQAGEYAEIDRINLEVKSQSVAGL